MIGRPVQRARHPQHHRREADREQGQDDQSRAGQHLPHFDPKPRDELDPTRGHRVARDYSLFAHHRHGGGDPRLRCLALGQPAKPPARRRPLGHREAPQGEAEEQRAEKDGPDAIEQHVARQRDQARVHVVLGPIERRLAERRSAQRLPARDRRAPLDMAAEHAAGDEITHDDHDGADVGGHHRPKRGRQREQDRAHQEDVGNREQREIPRIISDVLRPDRFRIDPRHHRSHRHAERQREIAEPRDDQAAEEPAEDDLGAGDGRCADDRREAAGVVADDGIGDEGGDHEQVEQREDGGRDRDCIRRVLVNGAGRSDADVLACRDPEAHQEEDEDGDPEHRVAQLVAEFEPADPEDHDRLSLRPRGGASTGSRNRRPRDRPRLARTLRAAGRPARARSSGRRTAGSRSPRSGSGSPPAGCDR